MENGDYDNTTSNAYSTCSTNNIPKAEYFNVRTDQYWSDVNGPVDDAHRSSLFDSQFEIGAEEQENPIGHQDANI